MLNISLCLTTWNLGLCLCFGSGGRVVEVEVLWLVDEVEMLVLLLVDILVLVDEDVLEVLIDFEVDWLVLLVEID